MRNTILLVTFCIALASCKKGFVGTPISSADYNMFTTSDSIAIVNNTATQVAIITDVLVTAQPDNYNAYNRYVYPHDTCWVSNQQLTSYQGVQCFSFTYLKANAFNYTVTAVLADSASYSNAPESGGSKQTPTAVLTVNGS